MTPGTAGLSGSEVEVLVRRYLETEPGVLIRTLRGGHGFLCRGAFGDENGAARLFAVTTDGGVLLRLPSEARDRAVERGVGRPNAALPEWVYDVDGEGHGAAARRAHGAPNEWIWLPIPDSVAFERRRPHIHEALEYCRHRQAGGDER